MRLVVDWIKHSLVTTAKRDLGSDLISGHLFAKHAIGVFFWIPRFPSPFLFPHSVKSYLGGSTFPQKQPTNSGLFYFQSVGQYLFFENGLVILFSYDCHLSLLSCENLLQIFLGAVEKVFTSCAPHLHHIWIVLRMRVLAGSRAHNPNGFHAARERDGCPFPKTSMFKRKTQVKYIIGLKL